MLRDELADKTNDYYGSDGMTTSDYCDHLWTLIAEDDPISTALTKQELKAARHNLEAYEGVLAVQREQAIIEYLGTTTSGFAGRIKKKPFFENGARSVFPGGRIRPSE